MRHNMMQIFTRVLILVLWCKCVGT